MKKTITETIKPKFELNIVNPKADHLNENLGLDMKRLEVIQEKFNKLMQASIKEKGENMGLHNALQNLISCSDNINEVVYTVFAFAHGEARREASNPMDALRRMMEESGMGDKES